MVTKRKTQAECTARIEILKGERALIEGDKLVKKHMEERALIRGNMLRSLLSERLSISNPASVEELLGPNSVFKGKKDVKRAKAILDELVRKGYAESKDKKYSPTEKLITAVDDLSGRVETFSTSAPRTVHISLDDMPDTSSVRSSKVLFEISEVLRRNNCTLEEAIKILEDERKELSVEKMLRFIAVRKDMPGKAVQRTAKAFASVFDSPMLLRLGLDHQRLPKLRITEPI